jgi:hypothetical protein
VAQLVLPPTDPTSMPSIDCTLMSHPSCVPADAPTESAPPTATPPAATPLASYDCVNECVSSLGVVALVDGAFASLGCAALPLACPVFLGAAVGTILGGCNAACRELEQ